LLHGYFLKKMNIYEFIPKTPFDLVLYSIIFGGAVSLTPYALAVVILTISVIVSSYTYIVKLFLAASIVYFFFGLVCLIITRINPRYFGYPLPTFPKPAPSRLDEDQETDPLLALIAARRLLRNSRMDSDSSEVSFSSLSNERSRGRASDNSDY
jgi:hypothetical protein